MGGSPLGGIFRAAHEFRRNENHRLGGSHHVVAEEPVVGRAQADRSSTQEEFDACTAAQYVDHCMYARGASRVLQAGDFRTTGIISINTGQESSGRWGAELELARESTVLLALHEKVPGNPYDGARVVDRSQQGGMNS